MSDFKKAASLLMDEAVNLSRDRARLPFDWLSFTQTVFAMKSKTYVPALATILLAKATDESLDVLSIKSAGKGTYSMRGLGHQVVVPKSREHGFFLRTTGAEPLNNQPWFRYNRIDEFERVKDRDQYEVFLQIAGAANQLTSEAALRALAAFIAVASESSRQARGEAMNTKGLTAGNLEVIVGDFVRENTHDRPRRLQAFAAACMDVVFADVLSRRLNDPSRNYPGDVHVMGQTGPSLSVEVRGKAVSLANLVGFVEACSFAGIPKAFLFVDSDQHVELDRFSLEGVASRDAAVLVQIFESSSELLRAALAWSGLSPRDGAKCLADKYLARLREIEAEESSISEWKRAVAIILSSSI